MMMNAIGPLNFQQSRNVNRSLNCDLKKRVVGWGSKEMLVEEYKVVNIESEQVERSHIIMVYYMRNEQITAVLAMGGDNGG
jgi:hypothetical protein